MKSNEQKIKDLDTKLNTAATNREYQILKDQIAADKMANSVLEDEIIEMMEQVDAFQLKDRRGRFGCSRRHKEKVAASRKLFRTQSVSIENGIVCLEAELKQSGSRIAGRHIPETYQRLVGKKGEDALPEVIDGALRRLLSTGYRQRAGEYPSLAAQLLPELWAAAWIFRRRSRQSVGPASDVG